MTIIWCMVLEILSTTDKIFCHLGPFFALLQPKKSKFGKLKKILEISSFHTSVPKTMIICYTVPEIWCMTGVIVIFHFGLFFALFKTKKKMKKMPGDITILDMCTKNYGQMMYGSWDMVCDRQMDGRTDRKSDI